MKPLGVAVVGLGIGEQHLRAYHPHVACEVRKLFDLDVSRAERLSGEFPESRIAKDFQEILEDRSIDIVSIASFDDAHFAQVCAALKAGKHVFVEKPMCQTPAELSEIKTLWSAAEGKLKLHSNLILRTAPLYRWVREQIRMGEWGQMYSFDGDYLYGRLSKITEGWRKDVREYSVFQGGGVHIADLLLWITGEKPVSVSASGNRICTRETSFPYPDFVAACYEFPSGLVARITANFGCVHPHHHTMRVFGTKASFFYDDAGARLHRSRDPKEKSERIDYAPLPANKGDLIPGFLEAIENENDDQQLTQSFFDGMSLCFAADKALKSGQKERIEYL